MFFIFDEIEEIRTPNLAPRQGDILSIKLQFQIQNLK